MTHLEVLALVVESHQRQLAAIAGCRCDWQRENLIATIDFARLSDALAHVASELRVAAPAGQEVR